MPTIQEQEQSALGNILKSQAQGGAAQAGGVLGAGADVPAVLDADPALRQLTEEAILTRTGQAGRAQASSDAFRGVPAPIEPGPPRQAPLINGVPVDEIVAQQQPQEEVQRSAEPERFSHRRNHRY